MKPSSIKVQTTKNLTGRKFKSADQTYFMVQKYKMLHDKIEPL